jgi:tyrosinase
MISFRFCVNHLENNYAINSAVIMQSSIHLFLTALLAVLATSTPIGSNSDERNAIQARQSPGSFYAITGATGGVQPRLEIRELQKNSEMWNLYLLAMTEFQAMDQDVIDSYYQIAGESLDG